jgi:hypothetical protein
MVAMQAAVPPRRSAAARVLRVVFASGVLVPLIFFLVLACFAPLTNNHELDFDEGGNLMKALLVNKGHALYAEIWSDQPPLLTLVLAQWLRWFGASLAASRVLILLFSALLLWAFYQTVRLGVSELAALISVALLLLTGHYVQWSISVMIGLPAVALAMLSMYLLLLSQRSGRSCLMVASGILLGLSVQTKLFTAVLVPVTVGYLCFWNEGGKRPAPAFGQRLRECGLWLSVMGVAFIVTGVLGGTFDPQRLIMPHLSARARTAFRSLDDNLAYVTQVLFAHLGYLPLAVAGVVWGLKRRVPGAVLASGWLAVALASLLYQKPLWYHHFLLMTVPLAWVSAFGIEAGARAFSIRDRTGTIATPAWARHLAWVFGILVVGLVAFNFVSRARALPHDLYFLPHNEQITNRLCPGGRSKPAWVFSDRPIYAFEAGLVVPPPAAVTSMKRLLTGELTEDMLLDIIRTYRPEYVVLERYYPVLTQAFMQALGDDYDLLEEYYDHDTLVAKFLGVRPVGAGQAARVEQSPARVLFDDWLSLEWSPALLGDHAEAGNCLPVPGLKWQRPTALAGRDLGLSLRLVDQGGNILARYDEPLGSDFNTMRDRAQMPYFLNLLIPEGTPPGNYDLVLIVYDPQTAQPLEATGAAPAIEDGAALGEVRVDRPAEALPLRPALADFGPVRLVAANTPATAVSPGGAVPLELLWQADADYRAESLAVVAQLLDDQGKVVAGLEEEPLNGSYGTAEWQPGELVRDRHVLSVPADAPPGRYNLVVGLYRLPSRERLKTPAGLLGLRPLDHSQLRRIEVR